MPHRNFVCAMLGIGIAATLALGSLAAAQTAGAYDPIVIFADDRSTFERGGPAEQLIQRARDKGGIRVIVGLRIVTRMEHTLNAEQLAEQRRRQRAVEDAIVRRVLRTTSAPRVIRFEFIPYISMYVNAEQVERLLADPQAVSIHEDAPKRPMLENSTSLIHASDLWDQRINGTDQVVAVLDTGFSARMRDRAFGHEMLRGKVVAEACFSTADPDHESLCPGGADKEAGAGTAVNCPVSGAEQIPLCDHGTHVASIAAGRSTEHDGVARGAKIIAIQVLRKNVNTNKLEWFTSDVALGLKYVLKAHRSGKFKIAAINLSLGDGRQLPKCDRLERPIKIAIDNLLKEGDIPTIVASGNDGYSGGINAPACLSNVIAVGNTRPDDMLRHTSNHSSRVALLAPGTDIVAAVPEGSPCIGGDGQPYCSKIGTSMAAPHVAGAFALLKGAFPAATSDQILKALQCSGKLVNERQPFNGSPVALIPPRKRIDVLGAYNFLKNPEPTSRKWEFTTGDEARDWTPIVGNWEVRGGAYKSSTAPVTATSVANCDENLSVVARFPRPGPGEGDDSRAGIGIVIKTQINHADKRYSGYSFSYDRVGIGEENTLSVVRWDGLSLTGGGGFTERLCGPVPRTWLAVNTFAVVSRGAKHKFVFNGQVVCQIEDATYKDGPIMVFGGTAALVDSTVPTHALDYFAVKSLPPEEINSVMDPAADARELSSDGRQPVGRVSAR